MELASRLNVFGKASQYKPQEHRPAESDDAPDEDESPLPHSSQLALLVFLSGWITQYSRSDTLYGVTASTEGFAEFVHLLILPHG